MKVLVASQPSGDFCFVSHIYQGGILDLEIVKRSKFLEVLLANRVFQLTELAAAKGGVWIGSTSTSQWDGCTGAWRDLQDCLGTVQVIFHGDSYPFSELLLISEWHAGLFPA